MAFNFYGNYGGLGWTNGQFGETRPPEFWNTAPKDAVDGFFKAHDAAYYYAQERLRNTGDKQQYWREIIAADQAVVNGIEGLPQTELDVNQRAAGTAAATAFKAKQIYVNYPGYVNGNDPSQATPQGDPFTGLPWPGIDPSVDRKYKQAREFIIRRDPLVLDLDGDGIELAGATGAVLFDHNADGIKTGTGWARPDDGFLVRDINGNGQIDTGRELFGVDTIKRNGGLATDGFDALRDVDSNSDGFITSADTAYADLRVWRDLDQNGISTANELFTLSDLGITSINTNGSTTGPQAGQIINNNQIALSATFTRNNQVRTVGAIDLETNEFFTQFPVQVVDDSGNPVAITAQAQALPQMNGSGMVRDMRMFRNHSSANLEVNMPVVSVKYAATF